MDEGVFLKVAGDLRKLDPEQYRVKIAESFGDFVRQELSLIHI